ncbi:hypothetical protein [Arthrobacter sp. zg-Y895]|nr:hypothetical protein [Arthrobacter sp. zg-Y895]
MRFCAAYRLLRAAAVVAVTLASILLYAVVAAVEAALKQRAGT